MNIKYIEESYPLGTADSLSLIKFTFEQKSDYYECGCRFNHSFSDIFNYHCSNNSDFTVASHTHRHSIPYGVLSMNIDV